MNTEIEFPKIEKRSARDLQERIKALARFYTPGWRWEEDDVGMALVKIFSRMWEDLILALNQAPKKYLSAFFDTLGITRLPPRPAGAPVSFVLSAGTREHVLIPANTRAAAGDVIFTTGKNIVAAPAKLVKTAAVNPLHDRVFDIPLQKTPGKPGVRLFEGENLQEHVLYLGHPELFAAKQEMKIILTGLNLTHTHLAAVEWQFREDEWHAFDQPQLQENKIILTKEGGREIKEMEINGVNSRWIRCKAKDGRVKELENVGIPGAVRVVTEIEVEAGLLPDMLFYNDVSMEMPEPGSPIYPLGKIPGSGDTFYIGSREAFSKIGADVTLNITVTFNGVSSPPAAPVLSWEYWDGASWMHLPGISEQLSPRGADSRSIRINPLPAIEPLEVNGKENYWIRVRLVQGHYGKEFIPGKEEITFGYKEYNVRVEEGSSTRVLVEKTDISSDQMKVTYPQIKLDETDRTEKIEIDSFVPGEVAPPVITSISLDYQWESSAPAHCITRNNLVVEGPDQPGKASIKPFIPLSETHRTFYLGFDRRLEKGPISLFFAFDEGDDPIAVMPELRWYYYSREMGWTIIEVTDNTRNFTTSGTVEFFIPGDFIQSTVLGREHYWIKAVDIRDRMSVSLRLSGMHLNTVYVYQQEPVEEEILGSGDFSARQEFRFGRAPVITEEIWVNEMTTLSGEEQGEIIKEYGEEVIKTIKDEQGNIESLWVRWQRVDDFLHSRDKDRHYVIQRDTGQVFFGNGINGKVVPAGNDNVKASYQVGGGITGNVGIGEISRLKASIPHVDHITNPTPAEGGGDIESMESLSRRGSYLVKHRNRAVTREDIQRIAGSVSNRIARVCCVEKDNRVFIIIIPVGEEPTPTPSPALLKQVKTRLLQCVANTLFPTRLVLMPPDYKAINITVDVVPQSIDIAVLLEKEIIKQLDRYLHPLTGGPGKKGWEFGRDLHISDIYALLEGIDGVDHVENLRINGGTSDIEIHQLQTPCPGKHRVTIKVKND